jgi:DNA-binding MarR family transcriptional regulator
MPADVVSTFIEQWRRERPDLTLDAMATLGRFGRVMGLATRRIESTLGAHGLRLAEFDVLASLRRIGPPYTVTPSQLTRTLMLSPAGVTSRLDKLEASGLVERRADPGDRRSLLVVLTDAGFAAVDAAVTDHVATEEGILAALTPRQRAALDGALQVLLSSLETGA